MSITVGQRLDAVGGRPTGFDYLRILLACSVILVHSVAIAYGGAYADYFYSLPGLHAASMVVLPMFFSLSGFLVSGSLERTKSLFGFAGLRVIRIYPALTVEVLLSAFLLGVVFTTLPLSEYFTSPVFFRYMVNVTGHISYFLPGVFEDNPVRRFVNNQLWTVPYELLCYGILIALALIGAIRKRFLFLLAVLALQAATFARYAYRHGDNLFEPVFAGHVIGSQLVMAFLAGVLIYSYRDRLPWSKSWAIAAAIGAAILFSIPLGEFVGVFFGAYLTTYLGLLNPRKLGILRGADYSYGVYLYGWPVQQALAATGDWARNPVVNAIAALVITSVIAGLSWHFIEKPALRLKRPLMWLDGHWIQIRERLRTRIFRAKPAAAPAP